MTRIGKNSRWKAILSVCLFPSSSAIAMLVARYKQIMSPMIKIIFRSKELQYLTEFPLFITIFKFVFYRKSKTFYFKIFYYFILQSNIYYIITFIIKNSPFMCPIHQNILNLKPSIENKKSSNLKGYCSFYIIRILFKFYF